MCKFVCQPEWARFTSTGYVKNNYAVIFLYDDFYIAIKFVLQLH